SAAGNVLAASVSLEANIRALSPATLALVRDGLPALAGVAAHGEARGAARRGARRGAHGRKLPSACHIGAPPRV
ncbi:hypothetical protein, partial [Streptomyces sp. CBMA29]|uniref:hypothetical protein n=1 Tax=Streptomyces sp. CBMA29 TaxID=1896314 RepID=UPI001CB72F8D